MWRNKHPNHRVCVCVVFRFHPKMSRTFSISKFCRHKQIGRNAGSALHFCPITFFQTEIHRPLTAKTSTRREPPPFLEAMASVFIKTQTTPADLNTEGAPRAPRPRSVRSQSAGGRDPKANGGVEGTETPPLPESTRAPLMTGGGGGRLWGDIALTSPTAAGVSAVVFYSSSSSKIRVC